MQTKKSQPECKRIMPERRYTELELLCQHRGPMINSNFPYKISKIAARCNKSVNITIILHKKIETLSTQYFSSYIVRYFVKRFATATGFQVASIANIYFFVSSLVEGSLSLFFFNKYKLHRFL